MPKLLPKANQLEERWIEAAKDLEPGGMIYLEVQDKKEQTVRMKAFNEILAKLSRDEPVLASKIKVSRSFKDRRVWVELLMLDKSPLEGYIKQPDGTIKKISVTVDPDRRRRLKLMVQDGLTRDEINDALEYPMTQSEYREFVEKGRFS